MAGATHSPHFVRVRHLRGFVEDRGGEDAFEGLSVTQVVAQRIKPWIKKYGKEGGQSIASLVLKKPEAKKGALVMHCMGQNFLELIDALEDRLGPDAYIYLDIFCCNVLENLEKSAVKWTEDVYGTIGRCGKVVLVCDLSLEHLDAFEGNPLQRLWCLYEMYITALFPDAEFEVIFTEKFHATIVTDVDGWSRKLRDMKIDAAGAKVTWPKSKQPILEAIEKNASMADFEHIVNYVVKQGFFHALQGEKTFMQKWMPCCVSGGLRDEKAWVEYLRAAKETHTGRLKESKPVEELNKELREKAANADPAGVMSMIDKKARVEAQDPGTGLTALHKAAFKGHLDMVKFLIEKKAIVNAQDASGATPLHNSSYKGELPIVQFLIENQADVNLTDNYKRTPLDKATTNNHEHVVDFLKGNGAVAHRLGSAAPIGVGGHKQDV